MRPLKYIKNRCWYKNQLLWWYQHALCVCDPMICLVWKCLFSLFCSYKSDMALTETVLLCLGTFSAAAFIQKEQLNSNIFSTDTSIVCKLIWMPLSCGNTFVASHTQLKFCLLNLSVLNLHSLFIFLIMSINKKLPQIWDIFLMTEVWVLFIIKDLLLIFFYRLKSIY